MYISNNKITEQRIRFNWLNVKLEWSVSLMHEYTVNVQFMIWEEDNILHFHVIVVVIGVHALISVRKSLFEMSAEHRLYTCDILYMSEWTYLMDCLLYVSTGFVHGLPVVRNYKHTNENSEQWTIKQIHYDPS